MNTYKWQWRKKYMRGSVSYQVHQLFDQSGINRIGHSKHADKEISRDALNAEDKAAGWHEVAQQMGIYSYSTADAYRDVWAQVLSHAKEVYGVKDIEKLTGEIVSSHLSSKVDQEVAFKTFQLHSAACEKLAVALDGYASRHGRDATYKFHETIQPVRERAQEELERFNKSRAYEFPAALVSAVSNPDHQLAAKLQSESGARVHEVSQVKESALHGIASDRFTRQELGFYEMSGKGGKDGIKGVSVPTYRELAANISSNGGVFKINEGSYRDSLKAAAAKTGQEYQGSHGLRWNWAQDRYKGLQDKGFNEIQAMFQVSKDMGHERADITAHYLRG
jgi:hypothetical protein